MQSDRRQVLKLQYVKEPIQQLVRSPNNDLLAVVTDHTVHICILPDPSHLEQPDTGPIRPKTQFLGHTTHVLSESRVASVLWHPLGANGSCLVTVTEDAVVRLWELNMENRWSSEHPTVAVDLRKLQYARSYEDDIQPAKMGDNRGFSTDAFGMEVASACFGGRGTEEEAGWSAMTLWVAMTEGDVYALCPLLPSKWQPPPSLIPSLTTSIQAQRSFLEASQATVAEKENCEQQYAWLAEIDREEPMLIQGKTEFSDPVPVYRRPKILKSVPQLQGPFVINPGDVGENLDIADIQVVAPTIDTEDLYAGEDEFTANAQGLSSSLVCLLSGSGRVYVCLDLTGVEAQWLPMKKPNLRSRQFEEPQELIILEAVDTVASQGSEKIFGEPPMLTADFHSRYAFFITHGFGVFYLSLNALVQQLDKEIQAENIAGLQVRMNVVMDRSNVLREQMLRFREEDNKRGLSAPAIMQDSDLGYFLLTTCDGLPHAAILDQPREYSESPEREFIALPQREELATQVPVADPRPAYQPPESLYQPLSLRTFVDTRTNSRYKHTLKDEIRLSAATLEIMTEAHRVISKETFDMGKGVSDLFARCDRMRHELRNQIQSVREIAEKVDHINEEDTDDLETEARARGREKLDERLQRVKERYTELTVRHKGLKKKLAQTGARPLSEKEQAWSREVEKLGKALLSPEHEEEEEEEGSERAAKEIGQEYWKRFEEVRRHMLQILCKTDKILPGSGTCWRPHCASQGRNGGECRCRERG